MLNNRQRAVHVRSFHTRYITHIINLALKDSMTEMDHTANCVRTLLNSIWVSVKGCDVLERLAIELNYNRADLLSSNCPTRWFSKLLMLKKAYEIWYVLNATANRVFDLQSVLLSKCEWADVKKVGDFLELSAMETKAIINLIIQPYLPPLQLSGASWSFPICRWLSKMRKSNQFPKNEAKN